MLAPQELNVMADPTAGPIVLGEEVIFASGRTVPGPFQTLLLTNHISRYASGPGIQPFPA